MVVVNNKKQKSPNLAKVHTISTRSESPQGVWMKRTLILGIVLVFFLAVPFAAMSADLIGPGDGGKGSHEFAVVNPNHTQVLGGKSTHASGGLANAASHSPAVVVVKGTPKGTPQGK